MFYGDHQFDGLGLGATASPGVCPAHPAQKPRAVSDSDTSTDGAARSCSASTRSSYHDQSRRAHRSEHRQGRQLRRAQVQPAHRRRSPWGNLTRAQVSAFAPQLAAFNRGCASKTRHVFCIGSAVYGADNTHRLQARPPAPSSGGIMPRVLSAAPAYYPPQQAYYPPRGPAA